MRLFIAIELDELVRKELAGIQSQLKQPGADVKWVEPNNIHITLKFLGDTPENKIQGIKDALKEIADKTSTFSISLSELGAFPNLSRKRDPVYWNSPRVIWVGIKEGAEELKKIANHLENEKFSAHITLGRMRSAKNMMGTHLKGVSPGVSPLIMGIDHITLFQSTLTPKGPIYTSLYEARLKPI